MVLQHIHNMWPSFLDLVHKLNFHSCFADSLCTSLRGDQRETQLNQSFGNLRQLVFIGVTDTQKNPAFVRDCVARRSLRLAVSLGKACTCTHNFSGGFHLRTKNRVDTRKLPEWKHRFFYTEKVWNDFFGKSLFLE